MDLSLFIAHQGIIHITKSTENHCNLIRTNRTKIKMSGNNGNNNGKGSSKSQSSNQSSNNSSGGGSSSNSKVAQFSEAKPGQPMSDYEYLKPWGGRTGFMASYGIKPTPEGFEESRELIDQMREKSGFGKSPYRE